MAFEGGDIGILGDDNDDDEHDEGTDMELDAD